VGHFFAILGISERFIQPHLVMIDSNSPQEILSMSYQNGPKTPGNCNNSRYGSCHCGSAAVDGYDVHVPDPSIR